MYPPVHYIKNGKNIIDYSLPFPQNLTIYMDLIIEDMDKIYKKLENNITKINRIQRKLFNHVYPNYSIKNDKTKYYVSRAYLDGEIKENQLVFVYCFTDRTEIFPIDHDFLKQLNKTKNYLKQYSHLQNKSGVYILKLKHNKYYIGSSHNIFRRLVQHWTHCGSKWTCMFQPIDLVTWIITDDLLHIENLMTKAYVSKYSPLDVRGGNFYI